MVNNLEEAISFGLVVWLIFALLAQGYYSFKRKDASDVIRSGGRGFFMRDLILMNPFSSRSKKIKQLGITDLDDIKVVIKLLKVQTLMWILGLSWMFILSALLLLKPWILAEASLGPQ